MLEYVSPMFFYATHSQDLEMSHVDHILPESCSWFELEGIRIEPAVTRHSQYELYTELPTLAPVCRLGVPSPVPSAPRQGCYPARK